MKIKLFLTATALVLGAISFGALSSEQAAEASPQISTAPLDLSAYIDMADNTKHHKGDRCTTVNPGTPFCYMMCDRSPRLRTCDEG